MDGVALYQHVLRFAPHLKARFLFSSGGGVLEHVKHFLASTPLPILTKPVRFEVLQQAILNLGQPA